MAGPVIDAAKALEYKENGNKCFQMGDFAGAEAWYTKALSLDATNPLLYTNRAMARLKLSHFDSVITDSLEAISLSPSNMKAYFQLAQAEIALHRTAEALRSSQTAHRLCVSDIENAIGKNPQKSLGPITELVLRCKKEDWERREKERTRGRNVLLDELVQDLTEKQYRELEELRAMGAGILEVGEMEKDYDQKIATLRETFEAAAAAGRESRKRSVPDWILDDISFSVMLDPVVTKTGQSYDRASILEHLRRSQTDPLTREPMGVEDLRPNLALKAACAEYLDQNGWAVDW